MPLTNELRDDILASVPRLRAFAISLSGNGDRADDLVPGDPAGALANIDSFQPGLQPAGLAVHDPAQPVPLGLPQAAPRGRGCRRQLCQDAEDPSRRKARIWNSRNSAWRSTSFRRTSAKR